MVLYLSVDRILRQQKAERDAVESAAREKAEKSALVKSALVSPPPLPPKPTPTPLISSLVDAHPEESNAARPHQRDTNPSTSSIMEPEPKGRPNSVMNSLQSLKRKLATKNDAPLPIPQNISEQDILPPKTSHITPLSNIGDIRCSRIHYNNSDCLSAASNIDRAIKACKEETGDVIQNRSHMEMVKESLNEDYCDISGRVGDLTLLGNSSILARDNY